MGKYATGQVAHGTGVYSFSVNNADVIGHLTNSHAGWEIIFGDNDLSVGAEIGIRNKRYGLSNTSSVLIYNAQEEHQEYFYKENQHAYALVINSEFIDGHMRSYFKSSDLSFKSPICEAMPFVSFARSIYSSLRSDDLSPYERDGTAEALVYEMIDSLSNDRNLKLLRSDSSICTKMLFKEIILLLHQNISNSDFSLDDLSLELGVTKFHLIRTTKRYGGFTPHAYLSKIRLISAKNLLLMTDLQVSEVASRCGFVDMSTFGKAFKGQYKTSPSKI